MIIDSIKFNCKQAWCELGKDNERATLMPGEYMTAFRVKAGNDDGGMVKYVTWDDPVHVGTGQKIAAPSKTAVNIIDIQTEIDAGREPRGRAVTMGSTVEIQDNKTSVPVYVMLTIAPQTKVDLTLTVDTASDGEAVANEASKVSLSTNTLSFEPWMQHGSFNLTTDGWNTALGDTFRVNFGFSGAN